MSAATGTWCPRSETFGQARYGRSRSGSRIRRPDDGELGGGEGDEDAERVEAREEGRVAAGRELRQQDEPDRERRGDRDRLARHDRSALEARELPRQRPVLGQRVRQARDARERRRRGTDEDQHTGDPHRDLERIHEESGERPVERRRDADERCLQPFLSERGLAVRHGVCGETDRTDEHGHHDDEPDRGEERSRQRATRLGRLLGEVRNGLETRVREHREWQREREVAPVLAAREAEPLAERLRREQERDPEHHEEALHEQVEQRDGERAEVETRTPCDPHACDHGDERTADDGIPRRLAQRRLADRAGEVVGHEERRECHDDEEVEEENPARHETGEIVERTAHEGRRSSGLRQGGGALRVRERDEDEHRSGNQENERREAERHRGHDPECDVQRRGDLPVRHCEQRRSVEDALEPPELPGHYRTLLRSRVKRATPSAMNSAPRT